MSEWVDTKPRKYRHAHEDLVIFEQPLDLISPELHVELNFVEAGNLTAVGSARRSLNAIARVLRPPQ